MRNVLLWNPFITTTEKSISGISFYTSDVAGSYAINVQGIGIDGSAGSKTIVINVK